jgi:hypothetical protein
MPGPEVGSVDATRKILRRTADYAGTQSWTDHIATTDDRTVYRRVDWWVVQSDPTCPERDKSLTMEISAGDFHSAISRRTCALRRTANNRTLEALYVGSPAIGAHLTDDGQPDRISHNAIRGGARPDSVTVVGIS